MKNDCVVFICQNKELTRERRGYYRAFAKIITTVCVPPPSQYSYENLKDIIPHNLHPILILQPEASPRLPHGLVDTKIPTACFQIDTDSFTASRMRWSMLFDYAFVFHPGFDLIFQSAGHPRAICLPHAVESDLFEEPEQERIYDVGWVGNLQGSHYSARRYYLEELRSRFRMNDISHYYSVEAMASIYKQSKIVVNISRDDYPKDANLRCFEAMAAGALLVTSKPSELAEIGLTEGIHFVTYEQKSEICEIVKFYLEHDNERTAIGSAAKSFVLKQHTYDQRVRIILDLLSQDNGKLFAPARNWDQAQVHATYLHYFAKHLQLDAVFREMREIRKISPQMAWLMIPTATKALLRSLQLSI